MPSHEALESTGSMRGLLLFIPLIHRLFLGFPSGLKTVSWRHLPNTCADTIRPPCLFPLRNHPFCPHNTTILLGVVWAGILLVELS